MRMPLADSLPKPSFERIDDELSRKPAVIVDELAHSFGYRDGSGFKRPNHYIRHTEPLDSDLMKRVEYDMDEQDFDWLQELNTERTKDKLDPVSAEIFEVVMDQLEKEWFDLMKRVPKPDMDLPAEDSCCAVCDDGEGENSNAIVFCDGCNLAVHQDCYGVPYIPEGQWLCRKCTVSPEVPVDCMLCPREGGAFKQTSSGNWAHLLCAIWIPEVTVQNQIFMEPIEHIENIPKSRWKLRCTLCKDVRGACIQCDIKSCYAAFHVSCARKDKLLCSMKTLPGQEEQPLRAYCERHLPPEMAQAREEYLKDLEERAEEIKRIRQSSKAARAYARTYKTGPPLVPNYIVDKVLRYIAKVPISKKTEAVLTICKYWSLKREARRGAPLLKRLHLEPWTTATSAAHQTEEVRLRKLEYLRNLKQNLIKIRELSELIQGREKLKMQQIENTVGFLTGLLFPHETSLRSAFDTISKLDEKECFRTLSSRNELPQYYETISTPMSWDIIQEKLDAHTYWDLDCFRADMELVWDNPMKYYSPDHPLHQLASNIKQYAAPVLASLSSLQPSESEASTSIFEPAVQKLEYLVSQVDETEEGQTLLTTLVDSLGDDIRELVDAIVKGKGLVWSQKKMISSMDDDAARRPVSIPAPEVNDINNHDMLPEGPVTSPQRDRGTGRSRGRPRKTLKEPEQQTLGLILEPNPASDAARARKRGRPPGNGRNAVSQSEAHINEDRKRKRPENESPTKDTVVLQAPTFEDKLPNNLQTSPQVSPTAVDQQMPPPQDDKGAQASPSKSSKSRDRSSKKSKSKGKSKSFLYESARHKKSGSSKQAAQDSKKPEEVNLAEQVPQPPEDNKSEAGSMSSLTDLDDNEGKEKTENDGSKQRRSSRRVSQAVPPQKHESNPPNVATRSLRKNSELEPPKPAEPEIPAGFILQIGAGQRSHHPRPEKIKREMVMGDPPQLNEKGWLDGGTLVWAKQKDHPWFPGVVYEPDDEAIPDKIHEAKNWFCETAGLTEEERGQVQIVQFFDNTRTWAWLHPKSIRLLFDNEERDHYLLHVSSIEFVFAGNDMSPGSFPNQHTQEPSSLCIRVRT
ncbi:hypothetical protein CPB86DRAFT_728789, partial [Serendipita vermifera]